MTRLSAKVEYEIMASIASELTLIKQVLIDLNFKIKELM
jgi:hypothetical protein